jgi:nitroreductase
MESYAEVVMKLAVQRKTIRRFKPEVPSLRDIQHVLETVCQAPSGSNKQPWRFVIIDDPAVKTRVRNSAEAGEKVFYNAISKESRKAYHSMGNSWKKPMLEQAPILIAVISDMREPNYRPSVWLAVGYLILALEAVGLGTVTYTPSDHEMVRVALDIPEEFQLETILPVGYADDPKSKGYRKDLKALAYQNHWGNPLG